MNDSGFAIRILKSIIVELDIERERLEESHAEHKFFGDCYECTQLSQNKKAIEHLNQAINALKNLY